MLVKMQTHCGPWYVHEHVRPFPGVSLERLILQVRRGVLTKAEFSEALRAGRRPTLHLLRPWPRGEKANTRHITANNRRIPVEVRRRAPRAGPTGRHRGLVGAMRRAKQRRVRRR